MNDFWTNILRYPRFFISSLIGLILVILTPFRNLFKNSKSRILLIVFSVIFFLSLYLIIKTIKRVAEIDIIRGSAEYREDIA